MNKHYNYNIITEINRKRVLDIFTPPDVNILIIKFGASWCGPCKKVNPLYNQFIQYNNNNNNNIIFADIDIDNEINHELYYTLKKLRMIKGIPTIMAFYKKTHRDNEHWYVPDDAVSGYNVQQLSDFFKRCIRYNDNIIKNNTL